jgi:capsular polysaccharide biosynthesis protein
VRFLFTTIQFLESVGWGRVGSELARRGHEVAHVAISRRSADALREAGAAAHVLPDRVRALGDIDVAAEAERIEAQYPITSLRSVYLSDPVSRGRDEAWLVDRTVRHFVALERLFDELRPDVLVPEVGSETMRTAAHMIALDRGVTTLFVFLTIFPRPLRLYIDTPHAPLVPPEEVRALEPGERAEVETFIRSYIQRDRPTLPHRKATITPAKVRDFARHVAVRATAERDNEYLRPSRFVTNLAKQRARATLSSRLHEPLPDGPFAYFPLHVTDDFKVKRVIPHCVDQAYLIEMVADMLPQGLNLVLKEHPVSIGRNPVSFLRRLVKRENVHLVDPHTSSHELIRRSRAVIVISSTVGLEALLHGRPVLTMGQPFYAGYGVTVDVDSFRELGPAIARVLRFEPDRERTLQVLHAMMRSTLPGRPAGLDPSPENAAALAASLEARADEARAGAQQPPLLLVRP